MMKLGIILSFFVVTASVFAVTPIPVLTGPVMDEASLLSSAERRDLETVIRQLQNHFQAQIWIINELSSDETIEDLSIRASSTWKLGDAKKDDGLLILIALKNRAVRIEVGQGLEGDIPDILAYRIIQKIIVPAFKSEKYFEGLRSTLESLVPGSTNKVNEEARWKGNNSVPWFLLILLFMFLPLGLKILALMFGLPMARRSQGRWNFPGGGSSWGGGGWSGGGGGFSGGGSSGRW